VARPHYFAADADFDDEGQRLRLIERGTVHRVQRGQDGRLSQTSKRLTG
jgi:hypothetical protein